MMRPVDPVYFDALVRLLARPDPADLPRRAHVSRFAGDPDRRGTRLPGVLMAWLQRRHLEVDADEPVGAAVPGVALLEAPASRTGRVLRRATSPLSAAPHRPGPYAPLSVARAAGSR